MNDIRAIEKARGDGVKKPTPSEASVAALVRRSLHTTRDLRSGHVLRESDLVPLRPGIGIAPAARSQLIGRRLRVALGRGEMLREEHLG